MTPQNVALLLQLATIAVKLVGDLRAQSGMTDEQLLDHAALTNEDTRASIAAFLAGLPQE